MSEYGNPFILNEIHDNVKIGVRVAAGDKSYDTTVH